LKRSGEDSTEKQDRRVLTVEQTDAQAIDSSPGNPAISRPYWT